MRRMRCGLLRDSYVDDVDDCDYDADADARDDDHANDEPIMEFCL